MRSHASEGKGSGARALRMTAGLFVLALTMTLAAVSAQAESRYLDQGEFGVGVLGSLPTRVAVEQSTGRVFVVDSSNDRVAVFADGNPGASVLTTFGGGDLAKPFGIAIDQSNGDVYVADAGNERVVRYESDGGNPPAYTLDAGYAGPAAGAGADQVGSFASAIALDPSNDDLLVADSGNLRVSRFDVTGAFVGSFDGTGSDGGPFTSLWDLALDDAGDVYAIANGSFEPCLGGASGSLVERFGADGGFEGSLVGPGTGSARSLAYDGRRGDVLVLSAFGVLGQASTISAFHGGTEVSSTSFTANGNSDPVGLAVNAGSGRVSALFSKIDSSCYGELGSSGVEAFDSVYAPDVAVQPALVPTPTSIVFHGTVNPGGDPGAAFHFEYRAKGATDWQSTPDQSAGSGTSPEAVEAEVTGLTPNLKYEFRLTASNGGQANTTSALNASTPAVAPEVLSGQATDLGTASAALRGTVTPFGLATGYHFEYGLTASYGSRAPAAGEAPAGNGYGPFAVTQSISGLEPGTTYHYRLVAQNGAGGAAGQDRTFTTTTADSGRAFELVSDGTSSTAVISRLGTQIRPDGDAFLFTTAGAINSPLDEAAPRQIRYISRRSATGWSPPRPLDVRALGKLTYYTRSTIAASEDLSRAVVTSDAALTPGAFEGGGNLYMRDTETGALTFIGGAPSDGPFRDVFKQWSYLALFSGFIGGSPDFSTVVFNSRYPLTPEATPGVQNIYRWSEGGGLRLESILPGGTPATSSSQNDPPMGAEINLLSRDGSVLAFGLGEEGVFVRVDGAETTPISVSRIPGDPSAPHPGKAVATSPDGRYVTFMTTDSAPLTVGAPEQVNNLYRYDLTTGSLEFLGGPAAPGGVDDAGVGSVLAVSADASHVYFLSEGRIVVAAGGEVRTISPTTDGEEIFRGRSVSANGEYFAFSSQLQLTGYVSEGHEQIYFYDAKAGTLTCASCPADGKPGAPAATMPSYERYFGNSGWPRITNDGEAFFDTTTRLVAADVNGRGDVYAYRAGEVSLVSPGTSDFDARFMDVSPSGDDVFFKTAEALVAVDRNNGFDVYDARVGGGIASQNREAPAGCGGESCQATTPPPTLIAPAVATGANVRSARSRCRSGKRAKGQKKRCARRGGSKQKPASKRHAGSRRRAGR